MSLNIRPSGGGGGHLSLRRRLWGLPIRASMSVESVQLGLSRCAGRAAMAGSPSRQGWTLPQRLTEAASEPPPSLLRPMGEDASTQQLGALARSVAITCLPRGNDPCAPWSCRPAPNVQQQAFHSAASSLQQFRAVSS
eukprot:12521623-Alexandrium_andersonii.AAC.1